MADKKDAKKEVKKEVEKAVEPVILPQRIHFNEFTMLYAQLDEMQKAGFKALCKKEWMYKEEWQEQLDKYLG
jgi:hypothetical protein